jgi:hypothetical protein
MRRYTGREVASKMKQLIRVRARARCIRLISAQPPSTSLTGCTVSGTNMMASAVLVFIWLDRMRR